MSKISDRVAAVRGFNRFYTNVIGVLQEGLLRTPHSLTESRVIFELAQRDTTELAELRGALAIDPGYMTRILTRLEADGLVTRTRSASDGRRQTIRLTAAGRDTYRELDARSAEAVGGLLARLSEPQQRALIAAQQTIRTALEENPRPPPYALRDLRPGDLGWVVERHGELYAREHGWDLTFEALVARIVAEFGGRADDRRERAWIADVDGVPAGCVFCMRKEEAVAQLRLLLVEPWARGLGIGGSLVETCIAYARDAGYRTIVLWTNDVLVDARRLYERAGFELVEEGKHRSFGHQLVEQVWSLAL